MSEYICYHCGLPITDDWCIWNSGQKVRHHPVERCFPVVRAEIERLRTEVGRDANALFRTQQELAATLEVNERLRAEVERVAAILASKLHQRRCHDCGHVFWAAEAYTPYCLCEKCNSQDTRLVKEGGTG